MKEVIRRIMFLQFVFVVSCHANVRPADPQDGPNASSVELSVDTLGIEFKEQEFLNLRFLAPSDWDRYVNQDGVINYAHPNDTIDQVRTNATIWRDLMGDEWTFDSYLAYLKSYIEKESENTAIIETEERVSPHQTLVVIRHNEDDIVKSGIMVVYCLLNYSSVNEELDVSVCCGIYQNSEYRELDSLIFDRMARSFEIID